MCGEYRSLAPGGQLSQVIDKQKLTRSETEKQKLILVVGGICVFRTRASLFNCSHNNRVDQGINVGLGVIRVRTSRARWTCR